MGLHRIIAFMIIFIEIPLCMKCCPTSPKFDAFMTQFQNSYVRAVGYTAFAVVMWLAVGLGGVTWQTISALFLTITAVSYSVSAARHQTPAQSTLTGGSGVSTIV
ncbi:Golgi apparatus membrane protein tvp18 [Actinomortierella ambigua]|nr:Golgi apparatus membrane protein tvp18 [Actinomortierella ambigua]